MHNQIKKFSKTALLIIDMQNDAIEKLVPEGKEIVPSIKKLLEDFRLANASIIFLTRVHRATGVDVEQFRIKLFEQTPFLVIGTFGAQVIEELKPRANEICVNKQRFSGFFQSDLLMILQRLQITSLVVTGIQTPNCIRGTVTDALAYDYQVTVVSDATIAQNPDVHQANIFDMHNMGACIKTVDELLSE